jgi:DNA polymerase II large subunit
MNLKKEIKGSAEELVERILEDPLKRIPSLEEAWKLSLKYKISLHPTYLFYWNELEVSELVSFLEHLKTIHSKDEELRISSKYKRKFEILGVEHKVEIQSLDQVSSEKEVEVLVFDKKISKVFLANLGLSPEKEFKKELFEQRIDELIRKAESMLSKSSCEVLSSSSPIEIRDKGGTYIGARMGRPEKAKMRKLDGRPHGLFSIGEEGGRLRNIMEAYHKGYVESQFSLFYDHELGKETLHRFNSKAEANEELYFDRYTGEKAKKGRDNAVPFKKCKLELGPYIDEVRNILEAVELPALVKGIRGTSNRNHIVEHPAKAFLRAKHEVNVNKDGTVRFDMIEMGLTHFKPKEIGTSIEKLKELGYHYDYKGNPLENENQLLEIFPQDVILPDCDVSGQEVASQFVLRTAAFVDEMLKKLYKVSSFYNFKTRDDTIGHLLIGLAPHTSAGILGRIIGYSKTQGCFSHPVWHAAQRRNLDGDENGVMLLLDGLVNFSREYLPDRRGAKTMDTSLVLTSRLFLDQIDDEVHGMDIVEYYPLEFYRAAKAFKSPKEIKIEKVEKRIFKKKIEERYLGYQFTHGIEDFNDTILCSSYKSLPTMQDKLNHQLKLGEKIRAVDEDQVGSFIIDKHFMKDIKGNLRKFSMQSFRCTQCNTIFRRPPLLGKCTQCGAPNIVFTISEGSIKKYLTPSFTIVKDYEVDPYIAETLELVNLRIEGVFGKDEDKQKSLSQYWS